MNGRGTFGIIASIAILSVVFGYWAFGQNESNPTDAEQAIPTHYRFSPFWTSLEECRTTILLHNNHIKDPLTVYPVLHLENGKPVELDRVEIAPLGMASIPVNQTMAKLGFTEEHFGGAAFHYEKKYGGALSVETMVVNPDENLSYSVPSYGVMAESEAYKGRHRKHALFRLPTDETEIFFAVFNSSKATIHVAAKLEIGPQSESVAKVELGPKQWKGLRLPRDLPDGFSGQFALGRKNLVGGVTLEYEGPKGALLSTGWVDDDEAGYSNMMSLVAESSLRGQKLYAAQVMVGEQQDVPAPGQTLNVESHLLVKNVTSQRVAAWAELTYTRNGIVHSAPIKLGNLKPGEIQAVDLLQLHKNGAIPRDVTIGSVQVEHFGPAGALTGRIVSHSENLTYGFYVQMDNHGSGSISGAYWSLVGDMNSLLTVQNVGEEEDKVTIELAYNGGSFILPAIPLQPKQARTLDLRVLAAAGLTDQSGNPFPKDALEGGYRITSSDPFTGKLVTKEQILSPSGQIAMPFYSVCDYVTALYFNNAPSPPIILSMGQTQALYPVCDWNYGTTAAPDASVWSSNTSVATISPSSGSSRTVSTVAPGQTNLQASAQAPEQIGPGECEGTTHEAQTPAEIKPKVSLSGPQTVLIGTTGNTITVSASGTPSGGSYSWSTTNSNVSLSGSGSSVSATAESISTSGGVVTISVVYTKNGQSSAPAHRTIQVQEPTALVQVTTGSATGPTGPKICPPEGCEFNRDFIYEVRDQHDDPIAAVMPFGDSIDSVSNGCGLTYEVTPPGALTGSGGRFIENLANCSSLCKSGASCVSGTGCTSTASQTWTVNGVTLSSDVKSLTYRCNEILVNGS